ncbi:serine hydrolase domain-containing protein [Pendulispora albinea]|uniref:Beta-lactamase family protein n=1 Tax=Pendulispora albinea TaxID=2741071 RepID=A0ABZ2LTA5_9BACT
MMRTTPKSTTVGRRDALKALGGLGTLLVWGCHPNGESSSTPPPDRVGKTMAGYVERGEVPGVVTLVSRRGEVRVDAFGHKAIGGKAPVQRDTIFRIASMSKPITAAAAMILVEEGKLRLDSPIDGLLPELANRRVLRRLDGPLDDTVPAKRAITVRDLLTFRMGFGLLMVPPEAYPIVKAANELKVSVGAPRPQETPAPDEWLRRLGTLPLMHQPGEKWMYHTGADVLGIAIARASGRSFGAFLEERIFQPLGMKDTGFAVPAATIDRLATSYSPNVTTGKLELFDEAAGGQWSRPPAFPSGGGGLASTADDMLAFGRMMLDGGTLGGTRVLRSESVQSMITDQLTPEQKASAIFAEGFFDSRGWGFGQSIITGRDELGRPVGTFGWDGGLGTSWYCNPKEDVIGILMTQRAWTSPNPPNVCRDFWRSVYASG